MRTARSLTAAALLATSLLLAACGGGSDDEADTGADTTAAETLDDALESQTPTDTVEVPSEDGALTIADWAAGGSSIEPTDPNELTQILSIVGTTADGYITEDAVVVRTTDADATVWCKTFELMELSTYTFIPVLEDGTGVDCG